MSSGERSVCSRLKVRVASSTPARWRWIETVSAVGSTSQYFRHAASAVELALAALVPVGGGRGQYLDHEIGRASHVLAAAQQVLAFPGDEQQVRLHDVGVGEDDVAGGG